MFDILEPLLSFFTYEELETAKPIRNICQYCKEECGNLFSLDNCSLEICSHCLDDFYDEHNPEGNELFRCPCHDKKIFDYTCKM